MMTDRTQQLVAAQQRTARKVWDVVSQLDRACVCAGGAPRDWYSGRPAKDLDFWLRMPDAGTQSGAGLLHEKFGVSVVYRPLDQSDDTIYPAAPGLTSIIDFTYNDCAVQLIVLEEDILPTDYVDTFDFDLCKITYNFAQDAVMPSPEFLTDIRNKTITYNVSKQTRNQCKTAPVRGAKLQRLFPTHRIVLV